MWTKSKSWGGYNYTPDWTGVDFGKKVSNNELAEVMCKSGVHIWVFRDKQGVERYDWGRKPKKGRYCMNCGKRKYSNSNLTLIK